MTDLPLLEPDEGTTLGTTFLWLDLVNGADREEFKTPSTRGSVMARVSRGLIRVPRSSTSNTSGETCSPDLEEFRLRV